MKIVHINTNDTGGAATAALRLHTGLLQQGIDSVFLSLNKNQDHIPYKFSYTGPYRQKPLLQRVKRRLTRNDEGQYQKNLKLLPSVNGNFEMYSFPFTDFSVEKNDLVQSADIIHLHWVSDFIHFPSFFKNICKPIVWTLHDMNPFQGGFHYLDDKTRNQETFGEVEERLLKIKREALSHVKAIAIITPSEWLGNNAKQSGVFNNALFRHIPNGLPLSVFKPYSQRFARDVFDLPADKKIILFVSEAVQNYRKGFDLLNEAIETIKDTQNIILVTIGTAPVALVSRPYIRHIGKVKDERLMSLLFSAADLFIIPSREDNLPNVMLESFACGTPVLSFKTGGMAECIIDGFNGFFAKDVSAHALKEAIELFCNDHYSFNKQRIREYAEREFALEKHAIKYIEVYENLIDQPV